MYKYLLTFAVAFVALTGTAAAATGTYAPIDGECRKDDHPVYEDGSVDVITSCIEREAWNEANSVSLGENPRQIVIQNGQHFRLTNGLTDFCPMWYPMHCVIEPALFDYFL